jgi:hypothetical protein
VCIGRRRAQGAATVVSGARFGFGVVDICYAEGPKILKFRKWCGVGGGKRVGARAFFSFGLF